MPLKKPFLNRIQDRVFFLMNNINQDQLAQNVLTDLDSTPSTALVLPRLGKKKKSEFW